MNESPGTWFLIRQNIRIRIKVTAHSPINRHSKKRAPLFKGQILFPNQNSNSLVWISKRRTLLISGQKSIPQIGHKISDEWDNNQQQVATNSNELEMFVKALININSGSVVGSRDSLPSSLTLPLFHFQTKFF